MLINLILMTVFWTAASFNFYVLTFYLKYIPGSIYVNACLACVADIVGHMVSGYIAKLFGVKPAFFIAFILASIGGVMLVIFFNAKETLIAVFVLFARCGMAFAFNMVYYATPQMFPTETCSTAFGICNVFARFISILSPLVAELPEPVPMTVFSVVAIVSAVLPAFLRKVKKDG